MGADSRRSPKATTRVVPSPLLWAAQGLALSVSYALVASICLAYSFPGTNSTPVWLPAGIAVAAVSRRPSLSWWVFASAVYVNSIFLGGDAASVVASCVGAVGNVAGALAGAYLYRGLSEYTLTIRFAAPALAAGVVSGGWGPLAYSAFGLALWSPEYAAIWTLGDVAGVISILPALSLGIPSEREIRRWYRSSAEIVALALLTASVVSLSPWPVLFIPLLCLSLISSRWGPRVAGVSMLVLTVSSILSLSIGPSPLLSQYGETVSILIVQAAVISGGIVALKISHAVEEKEQAIALARRHMIDLRKLRGAQARKQSTHLRGILNDTSLPPKVRDSIDALYRELWDVVNESEDY